MATRPQQPLTYDDYAAFPDDGRRWEIIEGEAFLSPSPEVPHQHVLFRLGRWIADFVDEHALGVVFIAPMDVVLSEINIYQPDIVYIANEDSEIVTRKNVQGTPTWLIEIVSDPVRDKKVKRDIYAKFGVKEYWAVDLALRRIEVHRPSEDVAVFEYGLVEPRVLPGFAVDVVMLFEVAGPPLRRL